ncbi:MAG: DUF721 domain-containing protein [Armatimonadetes bacterium]|nr:DUF721 domain-containing protein [Armatimonadota bacterium]
MSRTGPRQLGGLLAQALGRPEILKRARAQAVARRWAECVGDILARKSAPERFDGTTLWVAVSSAPWAQELRMQAGAIMSRLNEMAGERLFDSIRFSVRELPAEVTVKDENVESGPVEPVPLDLEVREEALREIGVRALGRLEAARRRLQDKDRLAD